MFYNKPASTSNSEVEVKEARAFDQSKKAGEQTEEEHQAKMFNQVNDFKEKCQKDSFVYIAIQ